MDVWSIDADTISIDSDWNKIPLFLNSNLTDFIQSQEKLFIVAPKGLGKTLLLKVKSNFFRSGNKAQYYYPRKELCEKIGIWVDAKNVYSQATKFQDITHWETIWDWSLATVILQTVGIILPDEVKKIIQDANSISDVVNILINERNSIYKIQTILPKTINHLLREIDNPVALFIDNIDEAFIHFEDVIEDDPIYKENLIKVWKNAQLAFIQSTKRITQLNRNIKIYSSIRSEVINSSNSSTDLQTRGLCTFINYTDIELREIFLKYLRMTDKNSLIKQNEDDEIISFIGFNSFPHISVKLDSNNYRQEDFFHYLLRHTYGRPREIIEMGRRIAAINIRNPNRSLDELRREVNKCSFELLNQYKKEIIPYFDNDKFDIIKNSFLTNVIFRQDIQKSSEIDPIDLWDALQYFYRLGLIGYVERQNDGKLVQRFLPVSEYCWENIKEIPDSKYYLFHPSLEEECKDCNYNFKLYDYSIIGNNFEFHEKPEDLSSKAPLENKKAEDDLATAKRSTKKLCNVHFGAGKLGLGLVVPVFTKLGRVIIIQRKSKKWLKVNNGSVRIINNDSLIGEFSVITDDIPWDLAIEYLSGDQNILLITDKREYAEICLSYATSISTALKNGLNCLLSYMNTIDPKNRIDFFPFENDIELVKQFERKATEENHSIKFRYVVADRICSTEPKISSNEIRIGTEKDYAVVIKNEEGDNLDSLFEKDNKIKLVSNNMEFNYFYDKKFWLLNGIHMVVAIYIYTMLMEKHIPRREWRKQRVNILIDIEEIKKPLEIFSQVQILRLLYVHQDILPFIYPNLDKNQVFQDLFEYSKKVFERVSDYPDTVDRVLDLSTKKNVKQKYKDRIQKIQEFVKNNPNEIKTLIRRINEDRKGEGHRPPTYEKILQETTDLLTKTSNLFLEI